MPRDRERWQDDAGISPHKVWVGERPDKGHVLYLRWRAGGNWKWRSLGVTLRDERGRVKPAVREMALQAAQQQYRILSGEIAPKAKRALLTIGETWAVITHPGTGLYPQDTQHRKEVGRALRDAGRILGDHTPWATLERAHFRMLARQKVDELVAKGKPGFRGAEIVIQRLNTIAAWLREEGHIPLEAAHAGRKWKADLKSYVAAKHGGRLPAPARPRHSLAEMRAILKAAPAVDPRFALMMALGAELRLGQVARCRRADLNTEHWALTVTGSGKKKGTVVLLTKGQQLAVQTALGGYLARMEQQPDDYYLFAAGKLKGKKAGRPYLDPARHLLAKPVVGTTYRKWFREAERAAGVVHLKGRGAYGLRRVAVDGALAENISRRGLKQHGGWTSPQIPETIYADQEDAAAREEARQVRAAIRGEEEGAE